MKILKIADGVFMCKEIKGDLKSLQEEVGGLITLAPYFDELDDMGIDIYADDEGLLKADPKISVVVLGENGRIENVLVGNIIFVGHDGEGNSQSLTEEQLEFLYDHLERVFFTDKTTGNIETAFTFIFDEVAE